MLRIHGSWAAQPHVQKWSDLPKRAPVGRGLLPRPSLPQAIPKSLGVLLANVRCAPAPAPATKTRDLETCTAPYLPAFFCHLDWQKLHKICDLQLPRALCSGATSWGCCTISMSHKLPHNSPWHCGLGTPEKTLKGTASKLNRPTPFLL